MKKRRGTASWFLLHAQAERERGSVGEKEEEVCEREGKKACVGNEYGHGCEVSVCLSMRGSVRQRETDRVCA